MNDVGHPPSQPVLGPLRAVLGAFGALALTSATVLAVTHPPAAGLYPPGLHQLYLAGRNLSLALGVSLLVAICQRVRFTRRSAYVLLAGLSLLIGASTLISEVQNFAETLLPVAPRLAAWLLALAVSVSVVAAAALGHLLDRPRWRWLAVAAGLAVLAVHPFVLASGYPAAHLFMTAAALALIAGALINAPLPRRWPQLTSALPWAFAAAIAAFALLVPPSRSMQVQMLHHEEDVLTPLLARLNFGEAEADPEGTVPAIWQPWFEPRDPSVVIPAAKPPAKPPIVLLLTIDSLRADVLATKENDKQLPNLAAFRDASLRFNYAHTPGSQTLTTLTSLFTGTYYSQQYWTTRPPSSNLWPHADETLRFPEILRDAGIPTFNAGATSWMSNEIGIVRGFSEDHFVPPKGTHFTVSALTVPLLLERLETVGDGSLFAFLHLLDAHYSVRPLARSKPLEERYLANLTSVDKRLGEVLKAVKRLGLEDRTYIIISSDHGEAFGEHDSFKHNTTLYEELLRVPLMIRGPKIKARAIDVPVSLIDLGPTILDLFAQPTPGHMMGQSLLGFLRGKNPELTRPIGAEGRLKKMLLFPDGIKAIVDDREGTAEVYDLRADPDELINLLDVDIKAQRRIDVVRKFFSVHHLQRDGYVTPYRR